MTKQEVFQEEAIEKIREQCHFTDYEGNGCRLDQIINEFLLDIGCEKLVEEINNVECWRA